MIAFVQPFGLETPGGGPRILRTLLAGGRAKECLSISTGVRPPPPTSIAREIHLPTRYSLGRLEGSRYNRQLDALALILSPAFRRKLREELMRAGVTTVHAVAHGCDFQWVHEVANELRLPFTLTIHDDPAHTMRGSPVEAYALRALGRSWRTASSATVISAEMGDEMCRRYGPRDYEIITDGLEQVRIEARSLSSDRIRLYFSGFYHRDYASNFEALAKALDAPGAETFSFTARGPANGFCWPGTKQAALLPWASDAEAARDFDQADALYLPLPFNLELRNWVRFSLSTKMVSYLGSGLPILYHGPRESAVAALLEQAGAGVIVDSLEPSAVSAGMERLAREGRSMAEKGLALARMNFRADDIRKRFWSLVERGRVAA